MKNSNFVKQDNSNATALSLGHFSTKFYEQSLYVAPLDVPAFPPSKDQVEGALVLPFHVNIVPLKGTSTAQMNFERTVEDAPFPVASCAYCKSAMYSGRLVDMPLKLFNTCLNSVSVMP